MNPVFLFAIPLIIIGMIASECFIARKAFRIPIVIIAMYGLSVVMMNFGMDVGKNEQLNRFSRLFPEVLSEIDKATASGTRGALLDHYQKAMSSAKRLDRLEMILSEQPSHQEKMPEAPPTPASVPE